MNKIEQIESRFNKCKECLQEYLKQLTTKKIELKNYYMETYRNRSTYDPEGKLIKYTEYGFDKLFEDDCNYINQQLKFITHIIELKIVQEESIHA